MRTTLVIPDHLVRQLKESAARRGETLSAVVAEALQRGLSNLPPERKMEPLPTHRMGPPRVDLSDRDALYRAMEES